MWIQRQCRYGALHSLDAAQCLVSLLQEPQQPEHDCTRSIHLGYDGRIDPKDHEHPVLPSSLHIHIVPQGKHGRRDCPEGFGVGVPQRSLTRCRRDAVHVWSSSSDHARARTTGHHCEWCLPRCRRWHDLVRLVQPHQSGRRCWPEQDSRRSSAASTHSHPRRIHHPDPKGRQHDYYLEEESLESHRGPGQDCKCPG